MGGSGTDRFYAATRKGLFTIERASAADWRVRSVAFLGDNVSYVLPQPQRGRVIAALDLGHFGVKLHRSLDGGRSWEPLATPAYPPRPEDGDEIDGSGRPLAWRLVKVWTMASGAGEALWCGTLPGGLFHSPDGGASWTLNRPLWDEPRRRLWFGGGYDQPGIHSICVDPRDPRRVLVAVSCGGVWSTLDDGATWNVRAEGMFAEYMPPDRSADPAIQDPHCLVQCRNSPDALWVQHHNGVFRSTDCAASWREVKALTPSRFGFATAVHPERADTAWFVPAVKDDCRVPVDGKLVVVRTRDGGATHEVLRSGLPQHDAYDLVYRHSLDIDASGDRLAFGSTTGSVFVTENQGDAWHALNASLPPIHCLRFDRP